MRVRGPRVALVPPGEGVDADVRISGIRTVERATALGWVGRSASHLGQDQSCLPPPHHFEEPLGQLRVAPALLL
eukprot:1708506-Alexandrium_andersonii.AAC.1